MILKLSSEINPKFIINKTTYYYIQSTKLHTTYKVHINNFHTTFLTIHGKKLWQGSLKHLNHLNELNHMTNSTLTSTCTVRVTNMSNGNHVIYSYVVRRRLAKGSENSDDQARKWEQQLKRQKLPFAWTCVCVCVCICMCECVCVCVCVRIPRWRARRRWARSRGRRGRRGRRRSAVAAAVRAAACRARGRSGCCWS